MTTEKQSNKTEAATEIPSIDTAQLDTVSGGCAACGMANCTMTNPAAARPLFQPVYRR